MWIWEEVVAKHNSGATFACGMADLGRTEKQGEAEYLQKGKAEGIILGNTESGFKRVVEAKGKLVRAESKDLSTASEGRHGSRDGSKACGFSCGDNKGLIEVCEGRLRGVFCVVRRGCSLGGGEKAGKVTRPAIQYLLQVKKLGLWWVFGENYCVKWHATMEGGAEKYWWVADELSLKPC